VIDYEAEVERILGGPPGKLAFRALCAVLGRAGSPVDLVARCAERLAAWPDEVREAPWSWLAALAAGHSKPTWSLVRSLGLGQGSRLGTRDPVLPDPRAHPEVRGVTHLDLGWYAGDQLTALTESLDHWDNLRAIRVAGLTDMDGESLARLAGNSAVTRLESLDLVSAQEGTWHFGKPRFRPFAGGPWRLRHAGLRAPDLVHLSLPSARNSPGSTAWRSASAAAGTEASRCGSRTSAMSSIRTTTRVRRCSRVPISRACAA
jgi:hypothetical protein